MTFEPNYQRMFNNAIIELSRISFVLDLDPNDGGAEPIIEAIEKLKIDIKRFERDWIQCCEENNILKQQLKLYKEDK